MSTNQLAKIQGLQQIVEKSAPTFNQLAKIHGAVHFEREAAFAVQILEKSSYIAEVAYNNPDSLRRAVINVAAVGLSLSPVHKLAYLVPRDKEVCLDVSYQGLVKLATDIGAIEWAVAEIVREKDTFTYKGVDEKPLHEFNAFQDRGEIVGAYCLAKLPRGYMTTMMALNEIYSIRDRSPAATAKTGPWKTDESEMIKKTVIKRASKSWPKSDNSERLMKAIEVSNETDPVIFDVEPVKSDDEREERLLGIRACLNALNKEEPKFVDYCARINKREIKILEDMTMSELEKACAYLDQLVEKKKEVDNAAS
jgi:recombination protein RecT